MSKINVEFDTQTKLIDAKIDGVSIDNLCKIEFCCFENEEDNKLAMVELQTFELDEEQKMYKSTRVCAKESGELINKEPSLHEQIALLLTKNNK